jgi:hypothetical protein
MSIVLFLNLSCNKSQLLSGNSGGQGFRKIIQLHPFPIVLGMTFVRLRTMGASASGILKQSTKACLFMLLTVLLTIRILYLLQFSKLNISLILLFGLLIILVLGLSFGHPSCTSSHSYITMLPSNYMQATPLFGQHLGALFGKTFMITCSYLSLNFLYLPQSHNYGTLILTLGMTTTLQIFLIMRLCRQSQLFLQYPVQQKISSDGHQPGTTSVPPKIFLGTYGDKKQLSPHSRDLGA